MSNTSLLANIFRAIQTRIASLADFNYVDQDLGQLEIAEKPPFTLPAVLIDLSDIQYSDEANVIQLGECTLSVRLCVAAYNPSFQQIEGDRKDEALKYYDTEQTLNTLLHGWCVNGLTGSFSRTQSYTERREDNLRVRCLKYKFTFYDNTSLPYSQQINRPTPHITTV